MSKTSTKLLALMCAVLLLCGLSVNALAVSDEAAAPGDDEDVLVIAYTEIPLFANDEPIGSGIMVGSTTYVPLLAFTEMMLGHECDAEWDQETRSTTLTSDELHIFLDTTQQYMTANGRYLYLPNGALNINGTILVPIRDLAKVFSLDVNWNEEEWSVNLDMENMAILESGDSFYNPDDLYWLSHVIYAESGNQPIEGKIAVGNVVMNRAADPSRNFPDTIKEVIFQYGQFSVVETGAIYLDPNESSVIAAHLCLEGYNTAGNSLFFLNPDICSSTWFRANRTFFASIGDHDFYV